MFKEPSILLNLQPHPFPRRNTQNNVYLICNFSQNVFSQVEIEVWEVELLYSLNREALVQLCAEAIAPRPAQPSVKVATSAPIQPTPSQPSAPSKVAAAAVAKAIPKFTGDVKYVCGMCFPRGNQCIGQNPRKPEFCAGANSHPWQLKMVVVYEGSKKKWVPVKPRHPLLRSEVHPKLCRHGNSCHRASCMFPHHPAEGTLWRYMAQYNRECKNKFTLIRLAQIQWPTFIKLLSRKYCLAKLFAKQNISEALIATMQTLSGPIFVALLTAELCAYNHHSMLYNWQISVLSE